MPSTGQPVGCFASGPSFSHALRLSLSVILGIWDLRIRLAVGGDFVCDYLSDGSSAQGFDAAVRETRFPLSAMQPDLGPGG